MTKYIHTYIYIYIIVLFFTFLFKLELGKNGQRYIDRGVCTVNHALMACAYVIAQWGEATINMSNFNSDY